MATLRVSEVHQQGAIIERIVLSDDGGPLLFRRTCPADDDALLEERGATGDEQARFDAATKPVPFVTLSQVEVAALPVGGNGLVAAVQAILAKPNALIGSSEAIQAILAKADADITQAELKVIVLAMARDTERPTILFTIARYFLRKWLSGWR